MEWLSDFHMYRMSYNPSGNEDIMTLLVAILRVL